MITVSNLEKSFGNNRVLDYIDIQFPAGKISGLVGRNGAGKTTLFHCIAGIESYSGNIFSDRPKHKNYLGYLTTSPYMISRITGREYIQFIANARGQNIDDIDSKNIFSLPLERYGEHYSTGMKKKLALTAMLMLRNEYYLFDEPFSGVDLDSNIIIKAIIRKLKVLGKTVIISSHIYDTLTEVCDSIHLLDKGKIAQSVTPDDFNLLESMLEGDTVDGLIDRLELK